MKLHADNLFDEEILRRILNEEILRVANKFSINSDTEQLNRKEAHLLYIRTLSFILLPNEKKTWIAKDRYTGIKSKDGILKHINQICLDELKRNRGFEHSLNIQRMECIRLLLKTEITE